MSERHVVVVGGGAAGTAAALAAREAGARVTLVLGRVGATSLTSGALDDASGSAHEDAARVVAALGLHAMGACRLATSAGTLRAAAGRDLALADLCASKGPVLVARVTHPAWDADALAAAFGELDDRGFVARDVGLVTHTDERAMQHLDLAALHDDDGRLARAAERIRAALGSDSAFGAVLLPPWLGVARPRASELSERVGLACGEVLVAIDGPAGARFDHARDRSLQNAKIETLAGLARRVTSSPDGCTVETEGGETLEGDAVVLATGGVLGGAVVYTPGDAAAARTLPPPARAPFALAYDAPVTLGKNGRPLSVPGSIFGVAPESLAWPYADPPLLESVGVLAGEDLCAAPRVFAAGDALEGRARTILEAFSTGRAAGRAASAV